MRAWPVLLLLSACSDPKEASDASDASAEGGPLEPHTYVMRKMFAGDSDRAFKPSPAAWRTFGADIDGKKTTASSTDVCARAQGALASAQEDGDDGIDNSFGANILPALAALGLPSPSLQWSQATTQAAVRVGLVTFTPSGLELRLSAIPPGPIAFDGAGVWPISALSASADGAARVRWPETSLGTSRAAGPAILTAPQNNGTLVLRVHRVALAGTAESAILSGVLRPDELLESVKQVIGANKSACSGPMLDAVTSAIDRAKDILASGDQDPSKPCDAISIGLGFTLTPGNLGPVESDTGPARPCP